MATATVLHFGSDDCHRVRVLRHAGYEVRELDSLDRLRLNLESGEDVDAVIVSEEGARYAEQAADLVRQHSGAPLVLFRQSHVNLDESRFDRVYPSLTPPPLWLFETAVIVMQSKELRAQSEWLRHEVKVLRTRSQQLRARSKELRQRIPSGWPSHDEASTEE
jgi:hypothetical protein